MTFTHSSTDVVSPSADQTAPSGHGPSVNGDESRDRRRMLADIRQFAPIGAARASEIEAARQIPPDIIETLKSIGIFRMLVPKSHGGLELDLRASLEIVATIAKIDGSLGWTAMIGGGSGIFVALLPRETYDHIYRDGPDVIFAGGTQPTGTAEAVAGGWRVNGRWPFASGCQHADWMLGVCVMTRDGKPLPGPTEGVPLMQFVFLPASYWQIEDTWHAAGLKGTGSHHILLRDVMVPAANVMDPLNSPSCLPGPLYNAPLHFIPLMHAPFALGVAKGAIDDLVAMAASGRHQVRAPRPMRESEHFQYELGRAQADLRAAQSYLDAQVARHWSLACAGTLRDEEAYMIEGAQAAAWVTDTCLRVVERCFTLGGGVAVYNSTPLQRRLRDLQVAAQHAQVQTRRYIGAGQLLSSKTAAG
jgi:alkylation response protein AidB-like acyl-CoA dehydrogenase